MGLVPAPATWSVRARVRDVAVLLAVATLTWVPPLPGGPAGWSPLAGAAGMLIVGAVIGAGRRIGAERAAAAACALGVTAWALLASGRFATADELTNLLMSLAPVFLTYAGHLYARDRRRAWTMAALLVVVAAHPWSTSVQAAADGLLYVCAPMLFGFYRQTQQMFVRTLTDRARDAERERDLCAEQARAQERTRMALELHDVVTHRVSLMVLHAGALRISASDGAVRDAAEKVRAIGCEALTELRELIGVLRGSQPPVPERNADPVVAAGAGPRARPPRIDGSDLRFAAAAGVWTLLLSTLVASTPPVGGGGLAFPWLEIVLQAPLAAALVLRRRHPHLAAVPTLAGTVVLLGLALTGSAGLHATGDSTRLLVPAVAPLVAYTVAAHSRRPALGAAVVLALLALAARPWAPYAAVVSVAAAFIGLPALLGLYTGVWRRLVAALTERAERARRERLLLADRARTAERARLTREMHAIVSSRVHDMLEWADRLGGAAPSAESARASAELITVGRQALDELRDLAGAFPAGGGAPGPAGDPADLAGLAAQSASVGVPVELVETGDPAAPSPAIMRTARHIVGEALTNVRKHAHGARVRVEVRYSPDQVHVRVGNDRPPDGPYRGDRDLAAMGSGTGLLGVRQRVDLVDGTLVAGATDDGGFVIDAILPAYVPATSHTAPTHTVGEPSP